MASKRKMVFGYRMEFGDISPCPEEAETVQYIYAAYHDNRAIDEKHILLWEQIVRVI